MTGSEMPFRKFGKFGLRGCGKRSGPAGLIEWLDQLANDDRGNSGPAVRTKEVQQSPQGPTGPAPKFTKFTTPPLRKIKKHERRPEMRGPRRAAKSFQR
jgi:hypothetical protein